MSDADQGRTVFRADYSVSRETLQKLHEYGELVLAANREQNLVSKSTEDAFWTRHLLDSAQLCALMPPGAKTCLDVGSGAGLPGIVIALMTDAAVTLVEPRRLRAEFLSKAVDTLRLTGRVSVVAAKVERVAHRTFDVITARAFASLSETIEASRHLATSDTWWLLPKGRNAKGEIADAAAHWNAEFEMVPSRTAPDAAVVRVRSLVQDARR